VYWLGIAPLALTPAQAGVTGAAIGATAAIAGALATAWLNKKRERGERRAKSQVDALHGTQEACVEVRQAYRAYRREFLAGGSAPHVSKKVEARLDAAFSRLDVQRARVWETFVRLKLEAWEKSAKKRFIDGGPYAAEDKAWTDLHGAIGKDLKRW
jgi:hypothetical protein